MDRNLQGSTTTVKDDGSTNSPAAVKAGWAGAKGGSTTRKRIISIGSTHDKAVAGSNGTGASLLEVLRFLPSRHQFSRLLTADALRYCADSAVRCGSLSTV